MPLVAFDICVSDVRIEILIVGISIPSPPYNYVHPSLYVTLCLESGIAGVDLFFLVVYFVDVILKGSGDKYYRFIALET